MEDALAVFWVFAPAAFIGGVVGWFLRAGTLFAITVPMVLISGFLLFGADNGLGSPIGRLTVGYTAVAYIFLSIVGLTGTWLTWLIRTLLLKMFGATFNTLR